MIKLLTCVEPDSFTLTRAAAATPMVEDAVSDILKTVQAQGDVAVLAYGKRFDGADLHTLEVTRAEVDAAWANADQQFVAILQQAHANITAFHEKQRRTGFTMSEQAGVVLGQKITPLDRVGVYVPGGTAAYPSTVLMDVVPAKLAGVGSIIMATPPRKDGSVNPDILVAARIAGVDRIFKMGGAQAVGALSYGTQTVPKVDKIVGPGNIYVATAKRMVFGLVDIDMIAGPSEILVIADDTANPDFVAVDLLSQAEHDTLASAVLVTVSQTLAQKVQERIEFHLQTLPRRDIATQAIENNSCIVVTDTLENAVAISNRMAPEHLEVCTAEPFALLPLIRHAGSIFLGHYAPEALGDYFAGPNHTLPTSGTARFSSPLGVDDFCKKSSFIYYTKGALHAVAPAIDTFATREGLHAHALSVRIRGEAQP